MNWKAKLRRFAQIAYTRKLMAGLRRIQAASEEELTNSEWVATLIRDVGLRYDRRGIYGSDARFMNFLGPGLWQIPDQFSQALVRLGQLRPASLLEIGTCDGWTFSVMAAYLGRFDPAFRAVSIDPLDQFFARKRVEELLPITFRQATSLDFRGQVFDLCFIDGDHSDEWVARDFDHVGRHARFCMFHDINDSLAGAGAVRRKWQQLQSEFSPENTWEYTQHPDGLAVMGIGILQLPK